MKAIAKLTILTQCTILLMFSSISVDGKDRRSRRRATKTKNVLMNMQSMLGGEDDVAQLDSQIQLLGKSHTSTPYDESHHRRDQSRIVGGNDVDPTRYPYYCYLVLIDGFGNRIGSCGGSLIHPDVVMSAAHCLSFQSDGTARVKQIYVIANLTVNFVAYDDLSPTGYEQGSYASRIWWANNYGDPQQFSNDFMIIQLLNQTINIPTLRLNPSSGVPVIDQGVVVVGTGVDSSSSTTSYLQDVEIDILLSFWCGLSDGWDGSSNMICAGGELGKSPCNGDSGGPLIVAGNGADSDVQVGIVSFGPENCNGQYAGFTRVSTFYNTAIDIICTYSSISSSSCSGAVPPPTRFPTRFPTKSPVSISSTRSPTKFPTTRPTTASPVSISATRLPTRLPTRFPTRFPTRPPTSVCVCYDFSWWYDSLGFTCSYYTVFGCTYAAYFPNFGMDATTACCRCGGGDLFGCS